MPLPRGLAREIGAALDAEAEEMDAAARAELALRTRLALEAWLDGTMTTSQAARALRIARRPGVRLVR